MSAERFIDTDAFFGYLAGTDPRKHAVAEQFEATGPRLAEITSEVVSECSHSAGS